MVSSAAKCAHLAIAVKIKLDFIKLRVCLDSINHHLGFVRIVRQDLLVQK
jgi:hypothetical protein